MRIQLAVLDMAGTTVADDGAVLAAFRAAVADEGLTPGSSRFDMTMSYVHDTMGQSKITVFRHLFDGDEDAAQRANAGFEAAYADEVRRHGAAEVPGAQQALDRLRAAGIGVCLTTGFAPATRDLLIDRLGWGDKVDVALSPADVGGRGRPHPDLILEAVVRLGVDDTRQVAVAGDTANDLRSGTAAGAAIVAGVLTGAHTREQLGQAPHTHILRSVAELPDLLVGAGV